MAAPKISPAGTRDRERASVLVDAVVAIALLCLVIGASSFAAWTSLPSIRSSADAVLSGIADRSAREAAAYEGK